MGKSEKKTNEEDSHSNKLVNKEIDSNLENNDAENNGTNVLVGETTIRPAEK